MIKTTFILLQVLLCIAIAPLLSGVIRKIKNILRMRKGAPILQPYFNLSKLFSKEETVSEKTSIIFTIAPFIVLTSVVAGLFVVVPLIGGHAVYVMGDIITLIFLLALGRFFIALAGLDAGSAFGGMGSSREMFLSSFTEPAAMLALLTVSLNGISTGFIVLGTPHAFTLSSAIAVIALFLVTLAETSRVPVDNQETHLELTMVHEAMVLEYSGRLLALMELAGHIKQILFFILMAVILMPLWRIHSPGFLMSLMHAAYVSIVVLCIGAVVAFVEVLVAKMRLFRVVDFLSFAFVLSCIAMLTAVMGF